MKNKIFFLGLILVALFGAGINGYAAQYVSNVGGGNGSWLTPGSWLVNGSVPSVAPTYNDTVVIAQGDSIYTGTSSSSTAAYCNNVTVNGKLATTYGAFYANGNITVNTGGVFNLNKNVFCLNVYNYGKFYDPAKSNSGSATLGIGFNTGGSSTTTVPGSGNYTILNDGIFGWYRSASVAGSNGCGFFVEYSNQAQSITITSDQNKQSNCVFTVCGLFPAYNLSGSYTPTPTATQNLNLYINQSIALVGASSPLCFSLQQSDIFTGSRTCTIAAGDTVFVGGYFHTKAGAPTVAQGSMTYNVYGCLDMASCNRSKNEMDLYTSATSPSVTINIGDGLGTGNAGTLVIGKAITLSESATSGQTAIIIPQPYSTVKFGYASSAPTIAVTNSSFPSSFYNLTVATGTYSVTLPTSSYTVSDTLKLTSGKLILGSNNLTAASVSGGSSSSYVETSGTGTLTQPASTSGTLFPIGTTAGYAPVTIAPSSAVSIAALVSPTAGTYTGYGVNANEWALTPASTTTAALAFTPSTATYITSPVIFSGNSTGNYSATTSATVNSGVFNASGISLGASGNYFATGGPSTITISSSSLGGFTYAAGSGPSTAQTFTVSGSNLTNNITLTATSNYMISTDGTNYSATVTLTQSNGSVASTTIYVELIAGLSAGSYNSDMITVSSNYATSQTVSLSGSVSSLTTGITSANVSNLAVYSDGKQIIIKNANVGDIVAVYGVNGEKAASEVLTSDNTTISSLSSGMYLVNVGNRTTKVIIY
jgi:hypothetical protein